MRIILAILVISILHAYAVQAQCPTMIIYSTQSQIDDFPVNYPSCTNMTGNILLFGSDISNLNGFIQLTSIVGDISLFTLDQLTSLSGLENLETLDGTLSLSQTTALSDITALDNLTSIGQDLRIFSTTLQDLSGLENITDIGGGIAISSNTQLTTIEALSNLETAQSITIINNNLLDNLSGLEGINFLTGGLGIINNDLLINLSGLEGITSIGGRLTISDHINLIDFSGLENLVKVGDAVTIDDNNRLKNFNGLNNLDSICHFMNIVNNDSLLNFQGLNSLEYIVTSTFISDNDALINLSGFDNLYGITESIAIVNNTELASLSGLENFTLAPQSYAIVNNPALVDISALTALDENITSTLLLRNNTSLAICAFPPICDYLNMGGNAVIEDNLFGCNSVSEVEADCNGALPVELAQFKGKLEAGKTKLNWQTVSEINNKFFEIEWKHEHSNWEKIGYVEGSGTSTNLKQYFFVHKTPLKGENYYRLKQVDFDDAFEYSATISVKLKEAIPFSVFPNPAINEITIQSQGVEGVVNIYNTTGYLLKKKDVTSLNQKVDISDLQSGLYLIEYKSETQSIIKRLVKM